MACSCLLWFCLLLLPSGFNDALFQMRSWVNYVCCKQGIKHFQNPVCWWVVWLPGWGRGVFLALPRTHSFSLHWFILFLLQGVHGWGRISTALSWQCSASTVWGCDTSHQLQICLRNPAVVSWKSWIQVLLGKRFAWDGQKSLLALGCSPSKCFKALAGKGLKLLLKMRCFELISELRHSQITNTFWKPRPLSLQNTGSLLNSLLFFS